MSELIRKKHMKKLAELRRHKQLNKKINKHIEMDIEMDSDEWCLLVEAMNNGIYINIKNIKWSNMNQPLCLIDYIDDNSKVKDIFKEILKSGMDINTISYEITICQMRVMTLLDEVLFILDGDMDDISKDKYKIVLNCILANGGKTYDNYKNENLKMIDMNIKCNLKRKMID